MDKDRAYITLVEKYRSLRKTDKDQKRSEKLLEAAKKLRESGHVSEEAIEAVWYL